MNCNELHFPFSDLSSVPSNYMFSRKSIKFRPLTHLTEKNRVLEKINDERILYRERENYLKDNARREESVPCIYSIISFLSDFLFKSYCLLFFFHTLILHYLQSLCTLFFPFFLIAQLVFFIAYFAPVLSHYSSSL